MRNKVAVADGIAEQGTLWLEATARLRKESVEDMLLACAGLPDVSIDFAQFDDPALSAGDLAPVISRLPRAEEMRSAPSAIHATLTTTSGILLLLLTCDPLGSYWVSCGVALFPGEELDLERQQLFAVMEVRGTMFCTTLDELDQALAENATGPGLLMFKVCGATLGHAPGVALA